MRKAKGNQAAEKIESVLRGYADRGIFQNFGILRQTAARTEYTFRWLVPTPFLLVHDRLRQILIFRNLLPGIPARSGMYRHLKEFLDKKTSKETPEHRRVDPRKSPILIINRGGRVSLGVEIRNRHEEYAARKAIQLMNEIFNGFLTGPYYDYMVSHFSLPEE
jgi:hypothetical protein